MSNINDIKKRAKAAGQRTNQNETKKGGGDFQAPAEGKTTLRLLEYIELGVQAGGMFKGKPKKPAAKVQIAFELLGKKHLREIENEKTKKTEVRGTYFRIFPNLALSLHEKAGFKKLYNLLRNSYSNPDEITHMSQLLGEAFAGKIRNNTSGDKTYSNLTDETGNFSLGAPVKEELDDDGEVISVKKLAVPELTMTPKLFLFDSPTKEDWEALDEKTQERIKKAENFKGSAVELLLEGGDKIKTHADEDEDAEEDEEEVAPKKAAKAPAKKAVVEEDEDDEEEDAPAPKKAVKKAAKVVEEDEDDADEDDAEEEEVDEEDEDEVAPKKAAKKSAPVAAKGVSKKSAPAPSGKAASSAKTASPSKAKGKKVADELDDLIDDED